MRLLHPRGAVRAAFDDPSLVSCAGLVPVMRLAEAAGLQPIVAARVRGLPASLGANPAGKVSTIVAGMVAGTDCIDDLDVVRHGGLPALFAGVYAPSTLGSFLRGFTHGHVLQLASAGRALLVELARRTPLLPGADQLCFVDIDSMLRRVYGKRNQGAAFGHTKVGGYPVLLRGYHPLIATLSTLQAAPVVAAARLRGGNAGSARGAASMLAQAIGAAQACGAAGEIIVRADSAFHAKKVLWTCRRRGARFSVTTRIDAKIERAIASIPEHAWVDIAYPQAIWDEHERRWISDAQIAETPYTAFEGTRYAITARLIVRRIKRTNPHGGNGQDELFPSYRYHAIFTDSPFVLVQAEAQHRGHAVIEQVNADLIDGPLGAPAQRPLRRQRRLAGLRRDRAQPHPRRRAPGRTPLRQGPRRDHPQRTHPRRRPHRPPRPPPDSAPARTLALAARLAPPVPRRPRPARLTVHSKQTAAGAGHTTNPTTAPPGARRRTRSASRPHPPHEPPPVSRTAWV